MRTRLYCVKDVNQEDLKDPDITKGKFYNLLDKNVPVMGQEDMYSFVGDNKVEIQRPKHLFKQLVG